MLRFLQREKLENAEIFAARTAVMSPVAYFGIADLVAGRSLFQCGHFDRVPL